MECAPPSLILPMGEGYFRLIKGRDFGIMKVKIECS